MEIYQVHSGFSLKMNRLDNFTVKNTNTIMMMELIMHGHQYLHSTEKQLYIIVELNFHWYLLLMLLSISVREAHFEMLLLTWMYLLLHIMLKIWKQQKTFINMLIMLWQAVYHQFQGYKL